MTPALPRQCVLDASVLIKYVVPEEDTPVVRRFLHAVFTDDDGMLYVPELLFIECANVLWKKVQRGEVDARTAADSLDDLTTLELDVTQLSILAPAALRLACDHRITAYDAAYVALAARLGLPLLTVDARLANSLAGTRHQVIDITGYSSPE